MRQVAMFYDISEDVISTRDIRPYEHLLNTDKKASWRSVRNVVEQRETSESSNCL